LELGRGQGRGQVWWQEPRQERALLRREDRVLPRVQVQRREQALLRFDERRLV
jgi:hypothetical protein